MDYIAIARKKFDLGAKQIEDKINAIYGDGGVYAWSRKEDNGVDSILANDCVNDTPLSFVRAQRAFCQSLFLLQLRRWSKGVTLVILIRRSKR